MTTTYTAEENSGRGRAVRRAFRAFWPLLEGDRRWLAVICGCVALASLTETAAILLFSKLTDHALQKGSLDAFWGPAAQWLAVAVLGALIGYSATRWPCGWRNASCCAYGPTSSGTSSCCRRTSSSTTGRAISSHGSPGTSRPSGS